MKISIDGAPCSGRDVRPEDPWTIGISLYLPMIGVMVRPVGPTEVSRGRSHAIVPTGHGCLPKAADTPLLLHV